MHSSWTKPFLQPLPRRRTAIMERAEPDIERKIDAAKIAFKISVVKLMMKVPNHHAAAVAKQHFMKPGMAEDRRQRQHVAMKHHQHRMRRHYKMNQ